MTDLQSCIHCGVALTFNSPDMDGTRDAWCENPSCSSEEETYTATSDGLIHVWDAEAREITQQPNKREDVMTIDSDGPTRDKQLRAIPEALWAATARLAKHRRQTIRILIITILERELEAQDKKDKRDARAQR